MCMGNVGGEALARLVAVDVREKALVQAMEQGGGAGEGGTTPERYVARQIRRWCRGRGCVPVADRRRPTKRGRVRKGACHLDVGAALAEAAVVAHEHVVPARDVTAQSRNARDRRVPRLHQPCTSRGKANTPWVHQVWDAVCRVGFVAPVLGLFCPHWK